MEKQPLISVIVPIYKVEDYLDRCVDSIVNQTYNNLEIILVDDGSPDKCPQMCDEWAERDRRIRVVHKTNGGLSDARNSGLKIASGYYIGFIDSDDYVSQVFFESLVLVMQQQKSDIVECGVIRQFEDGIIEDYLDDLKVKSYSTVDGLSALIDENPFHQHVWNKLYKTELVRSIEFPVGKYNEDEFWTYQVFGCAQKVTMLNKSMYYYFQRSNSIMGERYSLRRLDALEGKANRQEYIQEKFPELTLQAKSDLYGTCIFAYQCVLKYLCGKDKKTAKKIVYMYKTRYNLTFREIRKSERTHRKYLFLSRISFYLCCKIRAILGVGF